MNSQCPEQCLPNSGHSCWGWSGMTVRDMYSLEISCMSTWLSFEGRGWFITQKAVGSELASCLVNWRGWSLQATAAAGGHSADGICLVATVSQLDWEWRPGCMNSCEVHSSSPRTPTGRCTEAVVAVLCQISGPITAGKKAQGGSFWSQNFANGVLRPPQHWTLENWDFSYLGAYN